MKLEITMSREEQRLSVNSWWATSPGFVLTTLRANLEAARILWPDDLKNVVIGSTEPPTQETST